MPEINYSLEESEKKDKINDYIIYTYWCQRIDVSSHMLTLSYQRRKRIAKDFFAIFYVSAIFYLAQILFYHERIEYIESRIYSSMQKVTAQKVARISAIRSTGCCPTTLARLTLQDYPVNT